MDYLKNDWIRDFICGSFSGIFGTFFGHPFDTIKVRNKLIN